MCFIYNRCDCNMAHVYSRIKERGGTFGESGAQAVSGKETLIRFCMFPSMLGQSKGRMYSGGNCDEKAAFIRVLFAVSYGRL
ncbi:hypothetical protein EMIT079MI2_200079 [Bacillus sp. IT-79MI2]